MKRIFILLSATFLLLLLSAGAMKSFAQSNQMPRVEQMLIRGEIARARHGYIIRGVTPAEVFTILNPEPNILDEFVKTAQIVELQVRIVSGDNVAIETIDSAPYEPAGNAK